MRLKNRIIPVAAVNNAIKEIRSQGANIIIGPIDNEQFEEVEKFKEYCKSCNFYKRTGYKSTSCIFT